MVGFLKMQTAHRGEELLEVLFVLVAVTQV